jgi:hypothetical protein
LRTIRRYTLAIFAVALAALAWLLLQVSIYWSCDIGHNAGSHKACAISGNYGKPDIKITQQRRHPLSSTRARDHDHQSAMIT